MHENFIALDKEKRDRIVNAAMSEFSKKDFKNASTNEIVKMAGISKGALFHYFSSKEDLYRFLFRYSINFFVESTKPHIKNLPDDVFERWIAFTYLKMEIAAQYPNMVEFMKKVYNDDLRKATHVLVEEYERYAKTFQTLMYEGVDFSKFKDDVDVSQALKIIWWVLEGYAMSKLNEMSKILDADNEVFIRAMVGEMKNYLLMLRKSFYKEEFVPWKS